MPHESIKPIYRVAFKIVLYALFAAGMILVFALEAKYNKGPNLFNEESWTENIQLTLLALSTFLLWLSGKIKPIESPLTTLLAGMTTMAMIRECDTVLAIDLFDGAWQTGVSITAFVTLALVYRKRQNLIPSISAFMKRPSFGYFVCGFITIFVYSRLFGWGTLWLYIMGEDLFIRAVKNAAEEGTELFGYAVLLIACVELFLESLQNKNS